MSKASYLIARDPSISVFNATFPRRALFQNSECDNEKIAVYLRLKKTEDISKHYEIEGNRIICRTPNKIEKYDFSYIFDSATTQADIFNYIAKPKTVEHIEAKNFTLLTYGCTGSGKTYTLIGTDDQPGIIPRYLCYLFKSLKRVSNVPQWKPLPSGNMKRLSSLEANLEKNKISSLLKGNTHFIKEKNHQKDIFRRMEQRLSNEPVAIINNLEDVTVEVWVSFLEIYNENVYDLLAMHIAETNERPCLTVQHSEKRAFVKNLTSVYVSSGSQAFELLQYGLRYLNYASTAVNNHSSRSHCMFTIKLVQTERNHSPIVSYFTFCDLAGSERLKKTQNEGMRLKESNNINTSLFTLQKCLNLVRQSQKCKENIHIPYRESKLTELLQAALVGDENISMIVNFNPSTDMFNQSQIVLKFAAIASSITLESERSLSQNSNSTNNRSHNHIAKLLAKRNELRKKAEEVQAQVQKQKQEYIEENRKVIEKFHNKLKEEWESNLRKEIDQLKEELTVTKSKVKDLSEIKKEIVEQMQEVNYFKK